MLADLRTQDAKKLSASQLQDAFKGLTVEGDKPSESDSQQVTYDWAEHSVEIRTLAAAIGQPGRTAVVAAPP